jgi:hypothetical protein
LDLKFKAGLGYIKRLCLKNTKNKSKVLGTAIFFKTSNYFGELVSPIWLLAMLTFVCWGFVSYGHNFIIKQATGATYFLGYLPSLARQALYHLNHAVTLKIWLLYHVFTIKD